MKTVLAILISAWAALAQADHVPAAATGAALDRYQFDAAQKRYADIIKIADLIADYVATNGNHPWLDPTTAADSPIYEVAVLGQSEAVDAVFQNGTPFGFSLAKFRPDVLHDVLQQGLNRPVSLPIDPQRVGTHFAPVYFVFLRRAVDNLPAHFIVLGTFAQPVAGSTQVADNVHLVAISDADVSFIVPVRRRDQMDSGLVAHALQAGQAADALFSRNVPIALD